MIIPIEKRASVVEPAEAKPEPASKPVPEQTQPKEIKKAPIPQTAAEIFAHNKIVASLNGAFKGVESEALEFIVKEMAAKDIKVVQIGEDVNLKENWEKFLSYIRELPKDSSRILLVGKGENGGYKIKPISLDGWKIKAANGGYKLIDPDGRLIDKGRYLSNQIDRCLREKIIRQNAEPSKLGGLNFRQKGDPKLLKKTM